MLLFSLVDRPSENRKRAPYTKIDQEVERALIYTYLTSKAARIPLGLFHSSPAKGRLWKRGYRVRHRVLPSRLHVAAWIEDRRS